MSNFPALHDDTLHAAGLTGGSLVCADGLIWLPYDVTREPETPRGLEALAGRRPLHCASKVPFTLDWARLREVHILNASGVALGDAIVAFSVLSALKARHPHLELVIHQARHAPASVRQLAELARPLIGELRLLPQPVASIPPDATLIDLGDFAYWPAFDELPMFDFFAHALGTHPDTLPASARRNAWLQRLDLPEPPPPWRDDAYALFVPLSSSPLREIAPEARPEFVSRMADFYGLPVVGCAEIDAPRYHCVAGHSRNTAQFLGWIRAARVLVTTDTAALHAAAGFDIPTLAGFVSIDPAMRAAGYPFCTALDLRRPALHGLHHSEDPALLALAQSAWNEALKRELPWPAPGPA